MIETIYDDEVTMPIKERLRVEALAAVIMNFDCNVINEYDEMVSEMYHRGSYNYSPK